MAEFEKIEPTDLLKYIRSGRADEGDPKVTCARNFAHFFRPHLEAVVKDLQRQTQDGASFGGGIEDVAEIARTGILLAVEYQEEMLLTMLPTQIAGEESS